MTTKSSKPGEGAVESKRPAQFKDATWAKKIERAKEARRAGQEMRSGSERPIRLRRAWPR